MTNPFELDPRAIQATYEIEHKRSPMPDFAGFADVAQLSPRGLPGGVALPDPVLRAGYFDALLDLHELVEEYRLKVTEVSRRSL